MDFNRQNIFQATSAKTAVWDAGLRAYMLKVYNRNFLFRFKMGNYVSTFSNSFLYEFRY